MEDTKKAVLVIYVCKKCGVHIPSNHLTPDQASVLIHEYDYTCSFCAPVSKVLR